MRDKENLVRFLVEHNVGVNIDRFHCHAINTAPKKILETAQWKKPRK